MMNFGLSSKIFFPQRLTTGLLGALADSGVRAIELFAGRHHFDYTDRSQVREVAAWFRSNDVLPTLHAPISAGTYFSRHSSPDVNLVSTIKAVRIEAMEEIKRAIESAEHIPFPTCVIHLGLPPATEEARWSDYTFEYSLTAIEHLKAFAAPLGVRLLLENLPNEIATPGHLLAMLNIGHFDSCGICFDVAHAHLDEGGIALAFETLLPRIAEVHLSDNAGRQGALIDQHLWPASGTERPRSAARGSIDWKAVYELARTLPPETPLIFEIADTEAASSEAVTRLAREVISEASRLQEVAALNPPEPRS
jgi:sugar phosphate isomerase/epimerase